MFGRRLDIVEKRISVLENRSGTNGGCSKEIKICKVQKKVKKDEV